MGVRQLSRRRPSLGARLLAVTLFALPIYCGPHPTPSGPAKPRIPINVGDIAKIRTLLDSGDTAALDSLQIDIYPYVGGYYRRLLGRLSDLPSARQDSSALALHSQLKRWAAAYEQAFRQNTLSQMLDCYDTLDTLRRERWLQLEWLRREADSLYKSDSWARCDSLARAAAEGFEGLGDAYGAGRAWTRSAAAAEMRGDLDRAVQQGERALVFLKRVQIPFEESRDLHNIATTCRKLGRFERADACLVQAIRVARRVPGQYGRALETSAISLRFQIQIDRGRFPDSLQIYVESLRSSRQMATPSGAAEEYRAMGKLHALVGKLNLALAEYDTALALTRPTDNRTVCGECERDRGDVLVQLGRIAEAEHAYRNSRGWLAGPDDSLTASETLFALGRLLGIRGDYERGHAAMQSALDFSMRYGWAEKQAEYGIALGELGLTFGRHGEAYDYFMGALAQARRIGHREQELEALRALGRLEQLVGRFEPARSYDEQALRLARITGRKGVEIGLRITLAELSLQPGHAAEASAAAEAAGREARNMGNVGLRLDAVVLKARALAASGDLAGARARLAEAQTEPSLADFPIRRFDYLLTAARLERQSGRTAKACDAYLHAIAQLEGLTDQTSLTELRAGFLTGRFDVYREAVALRLQVGDPEGAFEIADRSRARSLVDRLTAGQMTSAELDSSTEARPDSTAGSLLPALRSFLGPEGRLIEYFRAEAGWLAFIVTQRPVAVVPLPNAGTDTLIGLRTAMLRRALYDDYTRPDSGHDWATPGAALYDDFWRPLTAWLPGKQLVYVAPEGPLTGLPFGALVMERPAARRPMLLLEAWPTAIVPSAETLVLAGRAAAEANKMASKEVMALAAGAAMIGFRSPMQREARDVLDCLPGLKHLLLTGSEATEDHVIEALAHAWLVHIACHARLNRQSPRFSWLELNPGPGTDGRLEVNEIERVRMKARLVTLSACETAVDVTPQGLHPAGEELIGMVRAFLGAGAAAVTASLWPVPDAEVDGLMHEFYTALNREPDQPALALNEAEVGLLARSGPHDLHGHPYLIAAFILVGAGNEAPLPVVNGDRTAP